MTDTQPDPEAKALAGRLRTAREVRYMPQEAVAAALGISRSAVSDIERATRQVSALELRRAAELFKIDAELLLYGEREQPNARPWDEGAVYRAGGWYTPPAELAALGDDSDVYERDGREAFTIASGPNDAGAPHLGVWLRADGAEYEALPMYEVTLVAGALHLRVYASAHRDLLGLLRELAPIVKDLHLADLAGQLAEAGRGVDAACAMLKGVGE